MLQTLISESIKDFRNSIKMRFSRKKTKAPEQTDSQEFSLLLLEIAGDNSRFLSQDTSRDFYQYLKPLLTEKRAKHVSPWKQDIGILAAFDEADAPVRATTLAVRILNDLENLRDGTKEREKIRVRIVVHRGIVQVSEDGHAIDKECLDFMLALQEIAARADDICISQDIFKALDLPTKNQFHEVGVYQGKTIFSIYGKLRDRIVIHPNHRNLPKREEFLEKHLKRELRIFSTTADNYFNADVCPVIEKKLRNGCRIRILLPEPASIFIKDRERQETIPFRTLQEASIITITSLMEQFTAIQLRFFSCAPTYQALIVDDYRLFAALPVFGIKGTTEFPCIEIVNGDSTNALFDKFTDAFEKLWGESKSPEEFEQVFITERGTL